MLVRNSAALTELEQAVVTARFALAGRARPQTLQEVGRKLGMSKERVRQVQIRALERIRVAMERHAAA